MFVIFVKLITISGVNEATEFIRDIKIYGSFDLV